MDSSRLATPALRAAAAFWYCVATTGLLLFGIYVAVFYGNAALQGRPEDWNQVLSSGWVPHRTLDNLVLASHLLFGALVTIACVLQLVPVIRRRWPIIHRWNGRVLLVAGTIASLGGFFIIWTRPLGRDLPQMLAMSLMSALILFTAAQAWRHARVRRFDVHRRWALRFFMVANSGWFFRIGLMAWLAVHRGPVGFDPDTFTGPFINFLSFAQFLFPLGVLECYFLAQEGGGSRARLVMAGGLLMLTLAMTGAIAVAAVALWLPRL